MMLATMFLFLALGCDKTIHEVRVPVGSPVATQTPEK
jgi:hypothetical protein